MSLRWVSHWLDRGAGEDSERAPGELRSRMAADTRPYDR